ncbi:MAG: TPM domain-containing protein [Anaerolineales bacterium]|nr:TPM domain-containing protein [Anaerolineales bacterium]MCB8938171.1 TPM domain-containing protein [Ardenticatenaceae bacterium]
MHTAAKKLSWHLSLLVVFGGLSWLWSVTAVSAQTAYPPAEDLFVNDYADVISGEDEAGIRALLSEFEAGNGVQMTVLTVESWRAYDSGDASIEQFATNLFNEWGIGDASRDDGVLFLVAVEDRELRIELGTGYGSAYNGRMQAIIDQIIVPYFRQADYSLGVFEGSRAIVAEFRGEVYESLAETNGTPSRTTGLGDGTAVLVAPVAGNLGKILLGLVAVVAPLGGLLISRFRRYKPRTCSNCQSQMVRLDERADDAYLDQGQIAEEALSSVDYDVWLCQSCDHREIIPYANWFTRYGRCPQCHYRTVSHSSNVVYHPTYSSTGLRRNRDYCTNCSHERITDITIPMRVQSDDSSSSSWSSSSSSSSSSSFGGGSSSGGGASGKW